MKKPTHRTQDVTASQLQTELRRVRSKKKFWQLLLNSICTLIVVAAGAMLVAVIFLQVIRIYGTSMQPCLNDGEIVVSLKESQAKQGDILAVYCGSKLLIKRCIATEQQWVEVDSEGNVYVDGQPLEEPYVTQKSLGQCNIDMPYQVPEGTVFVMGDRRETSIDSRTTSVGCIPNDEIIGKIIFRVWPLADIGFVTRDKGVKP